MYRRILAFDFDGTLADETGSVSPELQNALETLHSRGYVLFLATGRQLGKADLGPLAELFAGIVWENGAVLYDTVMQETYLPFGAIDPRLVQMLESAQVPLEHGHAIVSTWAAHTETVWHVVNAWGGDAAVVSNKGAVMILPAGAAKGSGLERLLKLRGFSPRNLVSFGDAENDLSLLTLGEFGIAVADAVPALKAVADMVTTHPGPAGVFEILETFWLNGRALDTPLRRETQIPLGTDEHNAPVSLSGALLAGGNFGVFGDSGSGKSWVAGLLAEGMHRAGYQILLIDPEGDFKGLRAFPEFVAFDGDHHTMPAPTVITTVLETVGVSVVLDLSAYPVGLRNRYVADLLRILHALKERKFRPHWIVLEEAQFFLAPTTDGVEDVLSALQPMLPDGGWTFVSYRPDQLPKPVIDGLDHCVLVRLTDPAAIRPLQRRFNFGEEAAAHLPKGHALLCDDYHTIRLLSHERRIPHIRHLYKYLDSPLPRQKRFYFRDKQGYLDIEAASLFEFVQLLPSLPLESLAYHEERGDFVAWAAGALGDAELAAHLRKLAHRPLTDEALREALIQRVTAHYAQLHTWN